MSLTIRPARAGDAAAAAPLVYSSGPAAFDYVFARGTRSAEAFLRRAFAGAGGEFGHGVHVVAEQDGKVVAVGAGYDGSAPWPSCWRPPVGSWRTTARSGAPA